MKAKMNARESKALAGLNVALKAKAEAKRKYEANRQRERDFDAMCARVKAEWDLEQARINQEFSEVSKNLTNAKNDVALALTATANESLTLNRSSSPFYPLNHRSQKKQDTTSK